MIASRRTAIALIAALAAAAILATLLLPSIPQPLAYHDFADQRGWLGAPNFLNVASNLPFLLVGALGLVYAARRDSQRTGWLVFSAGVTGTAFGSAYYHWAPSNATLFWDRLPLSIGFMALLAVVIGERISERAGERLLLPLMAAGAGSVLYWRQTDDLRFYGLVQFFPLLAILLMVWWFPARYLRAPVMVATVGLYGLAKVFEILDRPLFALGGLVSGHTLKHLIAAVACGWLLRMVKPPRPTH